MPPRPPSCRVVAAVAALDAPNCSFQRVGWAPCPWAHEMSRAPPQAFCVDTKTITPHYCTQIVRTGPTKFNGGIVKTFGNEARPPQLRPFRQSGTAREQRHRHSPRRLLARPIAPLHAHRNGNRCTDQWAYGSAWWYGHRCASRKFQRRIATIGTRANWRIHRAD